ncbi:MAG TPA: hypothetical protein VJW23_18655 [Propionibacteriaceae bacterium]|nr:hypothetical protein [Propionibacteriaceae bacterium]
MTTRSATCREDADFSAKIKTAIGIGLLILSVVPGAGVVAGGVGLVVGAVDVYGAFQDFYLEEAASGTAMDKAEAMSQSDPSLFSLGAAIAFGMLEGVAEVKALEGVLLRSSRPSRVTTGRSGPPLRSPRPPPVPLRLLGPQNFLPLARSFGLPPIRRRATRPREQILSVSATEAKSLAADLKQSLGRLTDPALNELIIKDGAKLITDHTTLADEAVVDPARLEAEYAEWQDLERTGPKDQRGKRFDDWLREERTSRHHGVITDPAGLMEHGLDAASAKRSFDAAIREDPTREAGVFRDATGEHVCDQGGTPLSRSAGWTFLKIRSVAKRVWDMVTHYHPDRG